MIEVALILAAGALAFTVARLLRLPSIPMLILSGVLLSALALLPDADVVQGILLLGLTFLVFSAGTELNPRRIGKHRGAAATVGVLQFLALGGAGLALAWALDFDLLSALYLGLGLAVSSTLVVVRLLQRREQLFEPFGRLVLGVLLVQDVLVILFISVLSHSEHGGVWLLVGVAKTLALLAPALVFLWWITPYILATFAQDDETLLLVLLAVLFVFVGFSQLLGLPLVVGAFLAGVSLSGFPVNGLIRGQLTSLSNFFLVVFFVSLGALLSIPAGLDFLVAVLLAAMILLLTPPLVTLLAERAGLSSRSAIEAGLLLSQASEFSIVLALVGLQQGHIDESLLAVLTLVTVITMILTPFVATDKMTWRLMRLHPSRWQRKPVVPPAEHILLLGCGESGQLLLDPLRASGERVVVVDDDPGVVNQLRERGFEAIRGDGADYRVLRAAGADRAAVVISTMRRYRDHKAILKVARGRAVICRVFEEEEGERLREKGAIPVLYSYPAADEFLRWFDRAMRAPSP
jgi:Kef-type K+ transport system membrane component KefB